MVKHNPPSSPEIVPDSIEIVPDSTEIVPDSNWTDLMNRYNFDYTRGRRVTRSRERPTSRQVSSQMILPEVGMATLPLIFEGVRHVGISLGITGVLLLSTTILGHWFLNRRSQQSLRQTLIDQRRLLDAALLHNQNLVTAALDNLRDGNTRERELFNQLLNTANVDARNAMNRQFDQQTAHLERQAGNLQAQFENLQGQARVLPPHETQRHPQTEGENVNNMARMTAVGQMVLVTVFISASAGALAGSHASNSNMALMIGIEAGVTQANGYWRDESRMPLPSVMNPTVFRTLASLV